MLLSHIIMYACCVCVRARKCVAFMYACTRYVCVVCLYVVFTCVCMYICWPLPSNQSFYRQITVQLMHPNLGHVTYTSYETVCACHALCMY